MLSLVHIFHGLTTYLGLAIMKAHDGLHEMQVHQNNATILRIWQVNIALEGLMVSQVYVCQNSGKSRHLSTINCTSRNSVGLY